VRRRSNSSRCRSVTDRGPVVARAPQRGSSSVWRADIAVSCTGFRRTPHHRVWVKAKWARTSAFASCCVGRRPTERSELGADREIVDCRRPLLGVVESLTSVAMDCRRLATGCSLPLLRNRFAGARCPAENVTQQQLRSRSWWSGPEIYLVVDDYDWSPAPLETR
jgi:S-DNA-T family DNA segregation ATPase FtsK/SpoIIIE